MREDLSSAQVNALETALSALTPDAGRLSRDRLLFLAGRASAARRRWAWPAAAAAFAVLSAGLGLGWALRPAPQGVSAVTYVLVREAVPPPAPPPAWAATPRAEPDDGGERWRAQVASLKRRQEILKWGVDALGPSRAAPADDAGPSLEHELGLPPGSLDRPNWWRRPAPAPTGDPS
jgi:hypothetical protein